MEYILAIDQGTTSSRAVVFDADLKQVSSAQAEFPQHFPASGLVEHDPEDIWQSTISVCQDALAKASLSARDVTALGVTNQRETTIVWDRRTGEPLSNAIVWQDRRTHDHCQRLRDAGHESTVTKTTGLLLDPYFSATKVAWILNSVDGAREAAQSGQLAFGTVDTYLIWRLTGGARHVTDVTNASRTMLFDIHRGVWSKEMCDLFDVPMSLLPEVLENAADFGTTDAGIFGAEIPIRGVAGDQQAAAIGQACFSPGMLKSTYGTGCFALLNTGPQAVLSQNRLLTTVAYRLGGETHYALEGSIFVAGAVVQWVRDELGFISSAAESESLALNADPNQNVVIVPAFTGLGAPYWNAECRGAVFGLTRSSGPAEFARAALESVGFQTRDLIEAMAQDWSGAQASVRVDGGMAINNWVMQFTSDVTGLPIERPAGVETTARGAAWLAGYGAGVYPSADAFQKTWERERLFEPRINRANADSRYLVWKDCVQSALATGVKSPQF